MTKITLLRRQHLHKQAEDTINEYLHLHDIRKIKTDALVENGTYDQAINLIQEGIQLAEEENLPGVVIDWKDRLLNIYRQLGAHEKVVKYAEELFQTNRNPMAYYHILKAETSLEDWPAYLEKLLAHCQEKGLLGFPNNTLAQIYIEEEYWDRLMQLVKKCGIRDMEPYEQYLKPRFPERLRDMFVEHITLYAAENMGRKHYRYVAEILKKLRTYPGGNEKVDKLLEEFRTKYHKRKAMMAELQGV